jgi:hypothetical protein
MSKQTAVLSTQSVSTTYTPWAVHFYGSKYCIQRERREGREKSGAVYREVYTQSRKLAVFNSLGEAMAVVEKLNQQPTGAEA